MSSLLTTPSLSPITLTIFLPLVLLLLKKAYSPPLDPREPPLLRPWIPFIGHILSLARESNSYYVRLFRRNPLPICTLPMLGGKLYVIHSAPLIAAGMRNRDLSFDPFAIDFSEGLLGIERKYVDGVFAKPGWVQTMTDTIHSALAGENVKVMKVACYREVAGMLNGLAREVTVEVGDVYEWLRAVVPRAFMRALFGERNPFGDEAVRALWDFDAGVAALALNVMPSVIASKAYKARQVLWDTVFSFYEAECWRNEDVSPLMRMRAEKLTRDGVPWDAIAKIEINIPWASVTNTVPDLFWMLVNVFSKPHILERFRAEAAELTTITVDAKGKRVACIDADQLLEKPYINAVYWETHRLYNENICNRRVMADTTIRDPTDGREYFLEKGINVQFANGSPHRNLLTWGSDADVYRPERWLEVTSAEEKAMRSSLFPFGGGRNLCPGRSFAISESLGLMSALAQGFEIEGVKVPDVAGPTPGGAMRTPAWATGDPAVTIRRRVGFEDLMWSFKLEKTEP
ncbi:cytochrome P450 [Podospora aff. communis PSN243]|uniref:Cytochrome P450 n=1 Tax=Podospora aff. communis PSN243 TaxID=3040156 RepID=A0AAV9H7F8_9PEZI|nr:cytochrome P450 [Podospora aff. communis PSN243]